jgi:anti-anti-sigma factor
VQLKSSRQGDVVIIEPAGLIDTKASMDFERQILDLFNGGSRLFAIDFAKVDLITSSGIRVLVMLAQRLHGVGGGLVLCALGERVRIVFDVSGLMRQFQIVASQKDAVAHLSAVAGAVTSAPATGSKLSRLAKHVLGGKDLLQSKDAGRSSEKATEAKSRLSSCIAELLTEDRAPGKGGGQPR